MTSNPLRLWPGLALLVCARRDVMSSSSSVGFCFVHFFGVVDGDGKVSMEAMVQLATSMHGEMRCRGFLFVTI